MISLCACPRHLFFIPLYAKIIIMKKYIYIVAFVILSFILSSSYKWYTEMKEYKDQYERAANNLRASESVINGLKDDNREYSYTINELKASRDSINQKLLATANKLKIKEKDIQYLQYQTSTVTKTDTITIKGDTIFKETMVPMDTVIGDAWYTTELKLRYPSTLIVSPSFVSEKEVIISKKKEYDSKPSKIFFIRWFQKKHDVITVDVIENNPYVQEGQNKFIKVVK